MTQLSWGGVHSLAHAPRVDQIMMRENFEIAWRRIVRRISAAFRTAVVCARASSRLALGCVRPGASGSGRGSVLTARLSPLCVLGWAMAVSGCAPGSAEPESRTEPINAAAAWPAKSDVQMCRPHRALLAPQPVPDCGFGRSDLKTLDPDQWAQLKLEYERKCYQNAEKIVHERLRQLQAAVKCEAEPARQ
jgi:hypothetical protein